MKILMLNYEYPPIGGGASPVTEELSEKLSSLGHQIDIITMHYNGLEKFIRQKNIEIHRVSCIRQKKETSNFVEMLTYIFSGFFKSRELIKKKKYDIVHCHFIIPTGIIAYFLKKEYGINYIITSHGSDVPGYNPDRFQFLHKLLKPIWKIVVNNASYITTPSDRLKNLITKNTSKKEIIKIHNGINYQKINLGKKEKIILYAGRLFKRKGVQHLIQAMDNINEWKLIIAGDGPYRQYLEELAKKQNAKINFLGWISKEKLNKYYEKSKIFVLPSSEESFGMVIVEAMMYGNAIISTSACSEVVGNSGLLLKDITAKELNKNIQKLTKNNNELNKYQKLSLIRAEEFSWDNNITKYIDIYRTVINND